LALTEIAALTNSGPTFDLEKSEAQPRGNGNQVSPFSKPATSREDSMSLKLTTVFFFTKGCFENPARSGRFQVSMREFRLMRD
jgi:hypothetical protein